MISRAAQDALFEQALNKIENRFLLSVLLAKRVQQLRRGAEPLVQSQDLDTFEEIVYREIVEEKLEWRSAPDQPHPGDMVQNLGEGDFDDTE